MKTEKRYKSEKKLIEMSGVFQRSRNKVLLTVRLSLILTERGQFLSSQNQNLPHITALIKSVKNRKTGVKTMKHTKSQAISEGSEKKEREKKGGFN